MKRLRGYSFGDFISDLPYTIGLAVFIWFCAKFIF